MTSMLSAVLLSTLGVVSSAWSPLDVAPVLKELVGQGDIENRRLGSSLHEELNIDGDPRNLYECYSSCGGLGKEIDGKWGNGYCCADDVLTCCDPRSGLIWFIVVIVIVAVVLLSCCCCGCCPLYQRMHRPQQVRAAPAANARTASNTKTSTPRVRDLVEEPACLLLTATAVPVVSVSNTTKNESAVKSSTEASTLGKNQIET